MGSRSLSILVWSCVLLAALSGCADWVKQRPEHRAASVVDYLFPDAPQAPQMDIATTTLRPPVRVGIAFVPGAASDSGISDAAKMELLERVKASFAHYPYIGQIEIIPSTYLRARGGFENLDQVARLFDVEVVALVSYDQLQFNDTNAFAVLYWTIVGAYVIHGDKYDVQTLVDATVFDVASRKLLFRAPGSSRVKGTASMASFSERSRYAQGNGYGAAVDEMIPQLQHALEDFRDRTKHDATVRIQNKPGYPGGGDLGEFGLVIVLVLAGLMYGQRKAL